MAGSAGAGRRPPVEERRRFKRFVLPMHVTAVRRPAGDPSSAAQVMSLLVCDMSRGGLCCLSDDALSEAEELTLFIPPRGGRGGRDVRCSVTRCEAAESRFRLGLMFRDPLGEAGDLMH